MFKKTIVMFTMAVFVFGLTFQVDAKRGGSRSSFKSRSYSKPKPAKRYKASSRKRVNKSNKAKVSNKTTGRKQVKKQTSKKPVKKFGANVKTKQKVANSRSAYKKQKAAFKPTPKANSRTVGKNGKSTVTPPRKRYTAQSNPVIRRTTVINRTTYINRRSNYYGGWSTPSYAYHGYSSYGMWDSLALWHMASNMSSLRYQRMYYHQRNTPGMIAWRLEAQKQARTNADLRAQLAQMDSSTNTLASKGVKVDPSFIPEGVDADVLLSSEVLSDTKPIVKICTGPTDKNYYNVAKIIGKDSEAFNVFPVVTAGSAENLKNMEAGKCDAALVQSAKADAAKMKADLFRTSNPEKDDPAIAEALAAAAGNSTPSMTVAERLASLKKK